jgi:hypothetical protein
MLERLLTLINLILENRTWLALGVLAVLLVLARMQPMGSGRRFRLGVWGVVLLGLGSVAAVNYVVNPYGLYPTRNFEPLVQQTRNLKVNLYAQQPEPPQIVVLGSSRTFTVDPAQLEALWGCPAFNAGLTGGRITDSLAFVRYIATTGSSPQIIIMEINVEVLMFDGQLVEQGNQLDTYLSPLRWQRITNAWNIGRQLVSVDQLQAVRTLLQAELQGRPLSGIQFRDDGMGQFKETFRAAAERQRPQAIQRRMENFDEGVAGINLINEVHQFWALTATQDTQIIGYLTPYRPDFAALLEASAGYQAVDAYVHELYAELQQTYPHIRIMDFRADSAFQDPALFVDIIHPTETASAIMMEGLHEAFGETVGCE